MSKKSIKSSLFRFVTLRSPQLVEDKDTGFVMIPDIPSNDVKAASVYYAAVNGITDEEAKKTALKDATFTPLESRAAVKAVNTDLYAFSSWLMRNKNQLSYSSIAGNLPAAYLADDTTPYDSDITLILVDETTIWDNLFHQTINKTSTSIREACIQMLIANKFVKAFKEYHDSFSSGEGEIVFTEEDENQFIKRANASVVIAKEVLLSNKLDEVQTSEKLPKITEKFLQEELRVSAARENILAYKKALAEIEKEEILYNNKNQEKYDQDYSAHLIAVENAYTAAKTTDAEGVVSYPGLDLPTFDYSPVPLDFQDGSGDVFAKAPEDPDSEISSETVEMLESDEFSNKNTFLDIYETLQNCIALEEDIIAQKANNQAKTISAGGTSISLTPMDIMGNTKYCYAGVLKRKIKTNSKPFFIEMNIATGRENAYISNFAYSLVNDSSQATVASTSSQLVSVSGERIFYKFFFDPNTLLTENSYTFSGTMTFENGDAVDFSSKIYYFEIKPILGAVSEYPFSGCGSVPGGNPNDDINQDVNIPSLKGVHSLGIADFRRVEQEVCCYVPGEVSHIENILAREYKEKATRSLVSTEITTEQTRETEVENLTDTTSTERNELQSEVSSVIDQQNSQSYGANASVNTKWFNAGTNFNASSSNATSLSNNEAQNYAQEVTEQALERIVQKVSSKRTSRVLREFEENNKHGFDNTKGEKHITGVYRWIDKIYKNQIVNYGKRLMYEFSIPEPSKFLKEALYVKKDKEQTSSNLLNPSKPIHPSVLFTQFTDAKYLTRENYQKIAAAYNAEVPAYPQKAVNISKGESVKGDHLSAVGDWHANDSFEINIPENYEAVAAVLDLHVVAAGPAEQNNHGVMIVGGHEVYLGPVRNKTVHEYVKFETKNISGETIPYPIHETLSVSIAGDDVFSVSGSVSAICELTDEAKEKWQNETFYVIMDAYQNLVDQYNDFERAQEDLTSNDDSERLTFNPAFNRSMEKRELKRLAIELLTKSTNITVSMDNYIKPNNRPEINATEDFEKHAAVVKFFEQAFDWEIMAYNLYPYYYASKDNWVDLMIEQDAADPIFQAFLQSGMSRMVVPVRPGFETAVNWYMSTGEIWNGQGLVTDINDDLYLSVAEEMLEPTGIAVGEPWETRIPTSLTIVQGKSAYLEEGGLPCNPDCDTTNGTIKETDFVISGGDNSNAASGVGADTIAEDNAIV